MCKLCDYLTVFGFSCVVLSYSGGTSPNTIAYQPLCISWCTRDVQTRRFAPFAMNLLCIHVLNCVPGIA